MADSRLVDRLRPEVGAHLSSAVGWTPWGWAQVWASEVGVVAVSWPRPDPPAVENGTVAADGQWAQLAVEQIAEYLAGERRSFALQVDWRGLSDFSRLVLESCRRVPYGETLSYGELAGALGRPRAARAVGQALAHNRLPLIIPCHRILAAGGGLGGFGGGLERKRRLLELEREASQKLPG